jgi:hypothetical protein
MSKLVWDAVGSRLYETGVDHGVLYIPSGGTYETGVAWNGLATVTETPSGAEANPVYADNIKYLNLLSVEEFGGTIEAYTYPDEFTQFDGGVVLSGGVRISQQNRPQFGLCYRTRIGNDLVGDDFGYKLHLVYGAQASPSERAYASVNDSPEAQTLSWEFTTSPVPVTGHKPTSLVTVDSTKVDPGDLAALELILYGSTGVDPRLPLPDEVIALFAGTATESVPSAPTFAANTITIPNDADTVYYIDGEVVSGAIPVEPGERVVVEAQPVPGTYFPDGVDDDWSFEGV